MMDTTAAKNGSSGNFEDGVNEVRNGGNSNNSPKKAIVAFEGDLDFEPRDGIEFDSHEAAYSFYQDYAKSMGFTTSIKNSRRSKKSKEFIDAKFACSRYGTTPESEGSSNRRPSVKKTDCKASMHVKRRADGKWIIHEFIKDHNHELLPALAYHFRIHRNVKLVEKNNIDILHAVSERTRKMYVEMYKQSGYRKTSSGFQESGSPPFEKGKHLILEEGDAQVILEYFKHIKKDNPSFFYAIDLNEEQRLRNLFWCDAKSRSDYICFNDVVSLDTSYLRNNDKLPFVPFVGVNHHSQPILFGCALIADETVATYFWLLRTWLRAMEGKSPKVILTDQDNTLKTAVELVLPSTRHCYHLWNVMEKIPETLAHVIKQHENFLSKFNKCIFKSWMDEEFDMRWWKMVTRFELQDNGWIRMLYDERKKWVPTFVGDTFFAGMSTPQRSEGINAFFDKYIHKKITVKEFMKQYGNILQSRFEDETVADFDTWHKQPALKSPSPWEKQMSTVYTHAIFKKFQIEVLGVVGCHPKRENDDEQIVIFRVEDCEKDDYFMVTWNEAKSEVSCSCHLFEYRGFLCRHAMIVLQICGFSSIPSEYILKRWTKDAKSGLSTVEERDKALTRVQRYNELCRQAIELSEEGSLSEEAYSIAVRVLGEALKNCVNVNNFNNSAVESSSNSYALREIELENQGLITNRTSKKRSASKKRKVQEESDILLVEAQDGVHQMDPLSAEGIALNSFYGAQQNVQGLLNLMEPPNDVHYVNQSGIQGMGHLGAITTSHDAYYASQQPMHGLGQIDYRTPTVYAHSLQGHQHVRSTQLHGGASRHIE